MSTVDRGRYNRVKKIPMQNLPRSLWLKKLPKFSSFRKFQGVKDELVNPYIQLHFLLIRISRLHSYANTSHFTNLNPLVKILPCGSLIFLSVPPSSPRWLHILYYFTKFPQLINPTKTLRQRKHFST